MVLDPIDRTHREGGEQEPMTSTRHTFNWDFIPMDAGAGVLQRPFLLAR
jgi:hypothetical protein